MIESRRFLPLLAASGALILLHQALDLVTLLPGSDLATPSGRVRQVLAFGGRSSAILVADFLLIWATLALGARGRLRTLAGVHFVIGGLLVVLLPLFLLDAGRVAGGFRGGESVAFRVLAGRTLLVLGVLGAGALVVGRTLLSLASPPLKAPLPVP